jgi:hypothetical protein
MAGKGDKPRNCYSKKFKKNYADIEWKKPKHKKISNGTLNNSNRPKRA